MPYLHAVGIDVSKVTLDVSIIAQEKLYHRQFDNTPSGIKSISKYIKKYVSKSDAMAGSSRG